MNLVVERPFVTPDFTAIKQRQQATWASGDFAVIGTTLQIVGESLAEATWTSSILPVFSFLYRDMNGMVAPSNNSSKVLLTLCSLIPKEREINSTTFASKNYVLSKYIKKKCKNTYICIGYTILREINF